MLKSKSERTKLAESAINVLKDGILSDNKSKINHAFEIIDDTTFSWIDLDVIFMEWEELCEKANDILFMDEPEESTLTMKMDIGTKEFNDFKNILNKSKKRSEDQKNET